MLISYVSFQPSFQHDVLEDRYLMVVDKMVEALAYFSHSDQSMDDSSSEDLGSSHEVDNDMTLSHFQKDAKFEALARRALSKRAQNLKKGENP